jgi:hypothetical protein
MEEKELQDLLSCAQFRYAKTIPKFPHHYTLRKTWENNQFDAVVLAIRELGQPRMFGNRQYIYYDFGGCTYWTMGSPIDQTILINRAVHDPAC